MTVDWKAFRVEQARLACSRQIYSRFSQTDQMNAAIDNDAARMREIRAWRDAAIAGYQALRKHIDSLTTDEAEAFDPFLWGGWPDPVPEVAPVEQAASVPEDRGMAELYIQKMAAETGQSIEEVRRQIFAEFEELVVAVSGNLATAAQRQRHEFLQPIFYALRPL